jgi:hypothetical protein
VHHPRRASVSLEARLGSCGESHLLVSWYVGDMCGMVCSDVDCGRSMRSDAEDRGWSSTDQVLDDWAIGRSGDTVCDLHCAHGDEECRFLG